MKALIFNGALERREDSTSAKISSYFSEELKKLGITPTIFNIAESGIPLFDVSIKKTPKSVEIMNYQFREADIHIWLTPLYHGSMTGAMKNCLDWLEISAQMPKPYLSGKTVGLVCWAYGVQAMNGINAMETVAKSLRAWTSPFNVPIQRDELYNEDGAITENYQKRFQLLLQLISQGPDILSK